MQKAYGRRHKKTAGSVTRHKRPGGDARQRRGSGGFDRTVLLERTKLREELLAPGQQALVQLGYLRGKTRVDGDLVEQLKTLSFRAGLSKAIDPASRHSMKTF